MPIIGTSPKAIDLAEDREHFSALLRELGLKQAEAGTATNVEDAAAIAGRIGYPVLLRPSFVLGGRGMIIVYEEKELRQYMSEAVEASEERPVLIDRFLENAVEIDVDVIADRERAVIGAIMQHVEPAASTPGLRQHDPGHGHLHENAQGNHARLQGTGPAPERLRPDEHPVRREGRTALRH